MSMLKLIIKEDVCGEETYYCKSIDEIESIVFNIFTDWTRGEDTVQEIDEHLRENGIGYIEVKKP